MESADGSRKRQAARDPIVQLSCGLMSPIKEGSETLIGRMPVPWLAGLIIVVLLLSGCGTAPTDTFAPILPAASSPAPLTPDPYSLCLFLTSTEDGRAVVGATVELDIWGGSHTARQTSSKIGEVCWSNLPGETIDLVISKPGYITKEVTLTLERGRNGVVISIARETCLDLELLGRYPLNFPTYHVQGLAVTGDFYYISSVDRDNDRGWLFKVDRETLILLQEQELTKGALIHPGGIEMDDTYLWIPNAEYDRDGPSEILAIDTQSLEVSRTFSVNDHIGLIASNGTDRLYGANWDSVYFYVWDWDGSLIEIVANPTDMAYQDCEFSDPYLVCGGTKNGSPSGAIDFIDPENWTLVYRIEAGDASPGHPLTREGLSFFGERVFLLPEDGPDSEIMIYQVYGIP